MPDIDSSSLFRFSPEVLSQGGYLRFRHRLDTLIRHLRFGGDDDGESSRIDSEALRIAKINALRPVVRFYVLLVAGYFFINTLFYRVPGDPGYVPALSLATTLICAGLYFATRNTQRRLWLEVVGHIANLLLIANTQLDIQLLFSPAKLNYYPLLLPIFAIAGVGLRVVLPAAVLAVTIMCVVATRHIPEQLYDYVWLSVTAMSAALGMSAVVRIAIDRSVRARLIADKHRDEAQHLANFDVLTGIANRRRFLDQVQGLQSEGRDFVLAIIDLDGFKPVNDIYGHGTGDALLIEVARRLREACKDKGVPARMGGDEFALILWGAHTDAELDIFGKRLCADIRAPYVLGANTAHVSGSVGFAHADRRLGVSQLLERADYALYHAKTNLRGAPVVFNAKLEAAFRDVGIVDQALREADFEAELSLAFQPHVDVLKQKTIGFEALARWDSPRLGKVTPDVFIPAAEKSGLINDMTLVLLKKALSVAATWPKDINLSFNLSTRDLRSGAALDRICEAVRLSGFDARRLEFEITETAMMQDFTEATAVLERLKALGCRVSIDDFGSGYSNLGYLHRLPVDKIKIDRSFVVQLLRHDSAVKIIKTMIDLCDNLGLDCVIEGVEAPAELARLRRVGARYIQGYLFARPMPAEDVLNFLEAGLSDSLPGKARFAG